MEQHLIYGSGVLNNNELQRRIDIVNSDRIILNNTDSLSSQLVNANCEYMIIYNFDLSTASITIPQNCTLNFQGGSISNGTITLQNTKLDGDVKFSGVTISGSCSNNILTPQMFGAYPTLTETESNKTQHTLAFENLSRIINNQNTCSKTVYVSGGHYSINKKIYFTESCRFYGDGDSTIFDLYEGKGVLIFGGTSSNGNSFVQTLIGVTITADVNKFDRKIVVNNTTGLNVGDYLIIIDTKDGSFNNSRDYFRTCECIKIRDIIENNIYIDDVLYGDYFADFGENYATSFSPAPSNRTVISKFTPCVFNLSNFKILSHTNQTEAANRQYYSFIIRGFKESIINNITVENYGNDVAACINLGLNYKIDKCIIRSFTKYSDRGTHDAYGLSLLQSQNFTVSDSTFRANSHAIATGSNSSIFSIQCRNFIYDNLHFETSEKYSEDQDTDYTFIDLDVHATAEYYKIINTIAPQTTCDTGGYNVIVEGCKFYVIDPTFNMGDYTIRNCELFGYKEQILFSNNNRVGENGNNAIIIENCIFHESFRLNFQDRSFLRPYEYLILRGNTFYNGYYMRYGYFKHIVIENNYVVSGSIGSSAGVLRSETFSFKNNVIKDGWSFWGFTGIRTEGIISNNTIIEATEHRDRTDGFIFSIRRFKGNFCQNTIISYSEFNKNDPNSTLISLDDYCDVNLFDNILQKGKTGTILNAIVKNTNYSKVTFERNIHNSIRRVPIEDSVDGSGRSTSVVDKYMVLQNSDLAKSDINIFNVGNRVFEVTKNKPFYLANKPSSGSETTFLSLLNSSGKTGCYSGKEATRANTLVFGNTYCCFINNSGTFDNGLCFSKYSIDDPNFNTDELYIVLQRMTCATYYSFTAPDPNIYPYIYCYMDANSGHTFLIYPAHKLCEYDGAAKDVVRRGTFNSRPNRFYIYQGFKYWATDLHTEIVAEEITSKNRVYWRETDGAIAGVKRRGTTLERPTGIYKPTNTTTDWRSNIYVGFKYFDTDLNAEIYASSISDDTVIWRETDGAIAGVKRIGTTSERPSGGNIYVGFRYYDTTLSREIYASAIDSNDNNAVTWTEMSDATEIAALSSAVSSLNTSVAALDSKISVVNIVYSELTNNTLSTSINNYYNISGSVDTLNITLNHNNESVIQRVIINLSTGSTPQIIFSPGVSGETVSYFDYYSINADSNYELNIIWNGVKWIVAYNSYYNS